jgi:CHAP domain/Putative peptidoglycan binding domain
MNYPNRLIRQGETDKVIVTAIQNALNNKKCGPLTADGDFGAKTTSAVKLFQTLHTDASGQALKADGVVGAITWFQLFDSEKAAATIADDLLGEALRKAISQIGVIENPPNSNRGNEVDIYLRRAGLDPEGQHYSWCAAFVYWCFDEASKMLGQPNPLYKTAGVLNHWNKSTARHIKPAEAQANSGLIIPGSIFIIDHGQGMGHTGIVERVNGGNLITIEGNTNPQRSRNGYGVFRLTTRKVKDINKGFLVYG